jgi:hypothetical protein
VNPSTGRCVTLGTANRGKKLEIYVYLDKHLDNHLDHLKFQSSHRVQSLKVGKPLQSVFKMMFECTWRASLHAIVVAQQSMR